MENKRIFVIQVDDTDMELSEEQYYDFLRFSSLSEEKQNEEVKQAMENRDRRYVALDKIRLLASSTEVSLEPFRHIAQRDLALIELGIAALNSASGQEAAAIRQRIQLIYDKYDSVETLLHPSSS
jgi:hypothetical protein